jgi:indole-3-glycerol phosphate synthase
MTYLDKILAAHRAADAARATGDLEAAIAQARALGPARGFRAALRAASDRGEIGVIAEIKRRSPSKGDLAPALDPVTLARAYESGGAACLSVLTDVEFFGGSVADLQAARSACARPVLRKDFTVSAADVVDARLMGADCVLLIAAALSPAELAELHALAKDIGLDVLVEIHDEAELEHAMAAGADLVGVNQRDLVTFQVDTARAVRVAALLPASVVRVAESGITGAHDAETLRDAGYHGVLVGETLVTSGDPARAVRELRLVAPER